MKYIKSFKNKNLEYEVGDCVKIKIIPDYVSHIERIEDNLFVKIIEMNFLTNHNNSDIDNIFIVFETLITKQKISGNIYFISKKMTESEIDYCKIKSETNKFNL